MSTLESQLECLVLKRNIILSSPEATNDYGEGSKVIKGGLIFIKRIFIQRGLKNASMRVTDNGNILNSLNETPRGSPSVH